MSFYANVNRGKGSKEYSPFDFMPHEQKPKHVEISAEDYFMSMVGK